MKCKSTPPRRVRRKMEALIKTGSAFTEAWDEAWAGENREWSDANPNELLSREQIEREYGAPSKRWLELAACRGDGPPMIRISWRQVRYQRGAFEAWLQSRVVHSTTEETA